MTQEIEYNAVRNPMEVGLAISDSVLSQPTNLSIPPSRIETLFRRMSQLEKTVLGLNKKENYVNAMAVDLEHIITILIKRLDNDTLNS